MKSFFSKRDASKPAQARQLRELTPEEVKVIAGGPGGQNMNGGTS